MKYYIIFGPPGAGKGTQSEPLVKDYNLCHISTGELLRAEIASGTELGMKAKTLIDAGNFVPDEVVEEMIANKIDGTTDVGGFLLDGFPRTLSQAEDFDRMLERRNESVTAVISLMIPDSTIHERLRHRALTEGRADDASEDAIANRIRTYHEKTEPLIEFYKACGKYHEVSGDGGPGAEGIARVYSHIVELMESL